MKRLMDALTAFFALFLLSPVLLVITALVFLRLGSPVFFSQIRPGLNGRPFRMLKFRTMTNEKTSEGALLPDEKRLTKFGAWLRSTSLDELPEIYNVLKGDMSLVGPRPLLLEYLPLYNSRQARRHDVRPGITGWAQINGRNAISWEEKFELDVWYVENRSLWLDIKIIIKTIALVVKKDGVSHANEATMPKFKGSGRSG